LDDPANRGAERLHQPVDFGPSATGQNEKDGRGIQVASFSGSRPEFPHRFDQRMADIGAWRPAKLAVNLWLEWKQREHVIHDARHPLCAPGPPGPHGRRYIVDDRKVRPKLRHPFSHRMGESGTVDDHQNVGIRRMYCGHCFANPAEDHRQVPEDSGQAHDGHIRHWKQTRHSTRLHAFAGHSDEMSVGASCAKRTYEAGAEQVARVFSDDDGYLQRALSHHADRVGPEFQPGTGPPYQMRR
jgi:hypothetical protein